MIVSLKNVSKKFKQQLVIDDVSIEFKPNTIYGLVGRNGSGKTVLLKLLCGIFNPTKGEILFDGEDYIGKYGVPKSTRALIESPEMIGELSGYDNLKLLANILNKIDDKRIYEVLDIVGLKGNENKKYKEYSLGMKQKLGIAQTIMEDSDLIILDEPFNGLDDRSADDMRKLISDLKKDRIIIIATHIKEDINDLIDELYRIDDGKLVYEEKDKK